MANAYIEVAPDGSGKKIQTYENTISSQVVEAQAVVLVDSTGTPITLPTGTNTGDVTLAGENYLTISSQVITAHAVDLSGTNATGILAAGRFPALTGDVTTSAGSLTTALGNIPTGTTMAGYLLATAIAAPTTPAAGKGKIYIDSTSKNLCTKDDAGIIKHGVQTKGSTANNFLTAIADDGTVSSAQPTPTDVGLGSVTNDAQTKAAIVPNTAPSAGQVPVGNAGGTAYAPETVSGDATLSSAGVLTLGALTHDLDLGVHKAVNATDPTNPQELTTKFYVDAIVAAISQSTGTGVITGCGVSWTGTGLVFTVAAGTYSINGVNYSIAQGNITLAAADATHDRFDAIVVNTSGAIDKITGTASAAPVIPTVDPSTQLFLTAVSVPANSTTPGNITSTLLYDENVGAAAEWNTTSSGSTWALGSTNNPNTGTKDIEATAVGTGAFFQLAKGSGTVDPSTQNSLVFYIRSKAAWPSNRSLTISLLNAGTQVGNSLTFQNGSFGFVSSNTTSYQQIVIPIPNFNAGNNLFNQIKFLVAGSGGSIGFYFDTCTLQAGVSINTQNFMVWRGTWSSSTAYVKNDVTTVNGIGYVALLPNTNSQPSPTNTNWQAFGNPIRTVGCTVYAGGQALVTGKVAGFYTCPIAGKITGWEIAVDSGTATMKTWKVATGTAVPTVSNNISTSGVAISSGTYVRSTTVSDFTSTTVAAGDIFAFNITAISGPTELSFQLEITPQ